MTTVGTYDKAQALLGYRSHFDHSDRHEFDVVLSDLLMPASGQYIGENTHLVGQEMGVGIFLALLAAKNGAKLVGLLTGTNHHDHPAAACIDAFNPHENNPRGFKVAGATTFLCNGDGFMKFVRKDDIGVESTDYWSKEIETIRVKDWGKLLDYMQNPY